MQDDHVRISGLHRTLESGGDQVHVLAGVDLGVARGETIAIRGRSGSGKSTLLQLIAGMDRPTSGSISVGDRRLEQMTERELTAWRGRRVGFIFQFFHLMPTLTALENVMLPMDFAGEIRPRDRRSRAEELLEDVGLGGLGSRLPSRLSGGEQQRVAIARALANAPELIIADEPTGNLDRATAGQVLDLLGGLRGGVVTALIATHDSAVAACADRIVELADGRLTASPERPTAEEALA